MNAGPISVVRYALPTKAKVLSLLVLLWEHSEPIVLVCPISEQISNHSENRDGDSGDEEDYNVFQHGELLR